MKTPYYLLDFVRLKEKINIAKKAQAVFPDIIIGYSVKTNNSIEILKCINSFGLYAEVVSIDEYQLALKAGFKPSCLIYNGLAKDRQTFEHVALSRGIVFIETIKDLEYALSMKENIQVGIRLNIDVNQMTCGQSQLVNTHSRFGFCAENKQLQYVIESLKNKRNIQLIALQLHVGANSKNCEVYQRKLEYACKLISQYNLAIKYLDIGGGVECSDEKNYLQFMANLKLIVDKNLSYTPGLIVEFGKGLINDVVEYVVTTKGVLEIGDELFYYCDGSRLHIDPMLKVPKFEYEIINKNQNVSMLSKKSWLVGSTCMEADRFFRLKIYDKILVGDQIHLKNVGAYTFSLCPHFILDKPNMYVCGEKSYE